jgi:Mycothiol maleylpyruvate isomerase N-terminal domain
MSKIDFSTALVGLDRAYTGVNDLTASLSRQDLLAFSRCHGWVVADVLFHLLCDAQRALVALASPAPGPPDRDFVTYWPGFAAEAHDPAPSAWWVRRFTGAFLDGTGVVALWRETAPAAVRAAGRADPDGYITTQGHVLAVPDFLATLVTEAVIHHLDMTVHLTGAPDPDPQAVALATGTLDGLLGAVLSGVAGVSRPGFWSAEEYLLKGTGRAPLTARDRDALGVAAERFPLLS